MTTLGKLRDAIASSPPPIGDLENQHSEKRQLARLLAQAYQDETDGKLHALQKKIGEWRRIKKFETQWENVPEKLMLAVTELGEAMEAYRHLDLPLMIATANGAELDGNKYGDQIIWLENFGEELGDAVIRIMDLCDALGVDLQSAICWKMAINEMRPEKHGKKC